MKQESWKNILWALLAVLALLLGYYWGRTTAPGVFQPDEYQKEIITVVDTVKIPVPVPKDSTIVRYRNLIVEKTSIDTLRISEVQYDTIQLPITQKEYVDSTYHAWVSGYDAALDSIYVFPKTTYTNTTNVVYKKKLWGVGLQVGVGYNGKEVTPYVGVGVSLNLWNF